MAKMSFKTALRRATEVRVYVHLDGTGVYIEPSKACVKRSDLYHDAPDGEMDAEGDHEARDTQDDFVWSFVNCANGDKMLVIN
tara:strand:+ start:468 stop:716 length:249 start_codon:yes stop_codon:yes gene_type:complete